MTRKRITDLLDVLGIAAVTGGLVGYDWRVAAVVFGVLTLIVSRINS